MIQETQPTDIHARRVTCRVSFETPEDTANADALVMRHYSAEEHINVGVAEEVTIKDLAIEIARVVGVEAALRFDP